MTSIHVKLIQQQHKFSITTVKEYKELLNSVIISRYKTEKKKKKHFNLSSKTNTKYLQHFLMITTEKID